MGRASRRLIAACGLIASLAAGIAGCAVAPVEGAGPTDPSARTVEAHAPVRAGPSAVLLEQSRAARAAGDYERALTAIERAVRIESNAPILWLEYGVLQLARGEFDQAITLARRAASLAGDDRETRAAASTLIADANRERARANYATEREAERH